MSRFNSIAIPPRPKVTRLLALTLCYALATIVDERCREYTAMYQRCAPLLTFYFPSTCSDTLLRLLVYLFERVQHYCAPNPLDAPHQLPYPRMSEPQVSSD